jgi:hypothetical protein
MIGQLLIKGRLPFLLLKKTKIFLKCAKFNGKLISLLIVNEGTVFSLYFPKCGMAKA